MNTCSFDSCEKPMKAKQLCGAHYRLHLLGKELRPLMEPKTDCTVPGCLKPHIAKGMCTKHYRRLKNHGDPNIVLPPSGGNRATGPASPKWKDRDISYVSAHCRLRDQRGKASEHMCECGAHAQEWAYDHSDPHPLFGYSKTSKVVYSPDVDRYQPMCGKCHRRFDKQARLERA